jgi:hypothetical protein
MKIYSFEEYDQIVDAGINLFPVYNIEHSNFNKVNKYFDLYENCLIYNEYTQSIIRVISIMELI